MIDIEVWEYEGNKSSNKDEINDILYQMEKDISNMYTDNDNVGIVLNAYDKAQDVYVYASISPYDDTIENYKDIVMTVFKEFGISAEVSYEDDTEVIIGGTLYASNFNESRKLESPFVRVFNSDYTRPFDDMVDNLKNNIYEYFDSAYPDLGLYNYDGEYNYYDDVFLTFDFDGSDNEYIDSIFDKIKNTLENYLECNNCVSLYVDDEANMFSIDIKIPHDLVEMWAGVQDIPMYRD